MKVLELFCGTKSISKAFQEKGYETVTVDNDPQHNPDICIDIMEFNADHYKDRIDVIWASPPCTCFSVASIGKHWTKLRQPKLDAARHSIEIIKKTLEIINIIRPRYVFIENPRGMLRTLKIIPYEMHTVTYCKYGDKRMKPTDIWTNNTNWHPKKMCHNGDGCHQAAPRGSKTGTQGLKDDIERGKIPYELCKEIVEACER